MKFILSSLTILSALTYSLIVKAEPSPHNVFKSQGQSSVLTLHRGQAWEEGAWLMSGSYTVNVDSLNIVGVTSGMGDSNYFGGTFHETHNDGTTCNGQISMSKLAQNKFEMKTKVEGDRSCKFRGKTFTTIMYQQ